MDLAGYASENEWMSITNPKIVSITLKALMQDSGAVLLQWYFFNFFIHLPLPARLVVEHRKYQKMQMLFLLLEGINTIIVSWQSLHNLRREL